MDLYRSIRPLLFAMDEERGHDLALGLLHLVSQSNMLLGTLSGQARKNLPDCPTRVMGIDFPSPVGLAAGLDKDARALGAFRALGFGFVELGTVTPQPQPGNPRKRLFRLVSANAIINRMGFNSVGIEAFLTHLHRQQPDQTPIGINIGKNAVTPLEHALDDYEAGLRAVYDVASYVAVNISSPNTTGLRSIQTSDVFDRFLSTLMQVRERLADHHGKRVPLVVKIAPDLSGEEIDTISESLLRHQVDGVIATNTTLTRPGVQHLAISAEKGGLSGQPLFDLSIRVVGRLFERLQGEVSIIGVGGICSDQDAWTMFCRGADLVQLYTGFIYRGPRLLAEILHRFQGEIEKRDANDLTELARLVRTSSPGLQSELN